MPLAFDDPALPELLEETEESLLDEAPFGIVRMSPEGTVTFYNSTECDFSGLRKEQVEGHNFFTDVAPCTNNFMVAERYREEELDTVLEYVFTFVMEPTEVTLRLIRRRENLYMLVKPN